MLYMTHEEVEISWRGSLTEDTLRSRHIWIVLIFNALNILAFASLLSKFHYRPEILVRMLFLLAFVVGFLAFAGYYFIGLYRYMNSELKRTPAASSLLRVSYVAYRLYLLCLGISFTLLGCIRLVMYQGTSRF